MISFFFTGLRLLRAVARGLRQDEDFRAILALFLITLLGGSFFYIGVEGWSYVDALYFCVMTMSTIGYGDFSPTTPFSKVFTIVYSLVSIGLFAAVASKIVFYILRTSKKPGQKPRRRHRGLTKRTGQGRKNPVSENEN